MARLHAEKADAAGPRPAGRRALLLAMDQDEIEKDWLDNLRENARRLLRDAKIGFSWPRRAARNSWSSAHQARATRTRR